MKKYRRYHGVICLLFTVLFGICLFGACVSQTPPISEGAAPASPAKAGTTTVPNEHLPPGDGLDTPAFAGIPIEAKNYLKTLAAAFRNADKEFIISQGEAQYEKELRPQYDEEVYLALLYRAGSQNGDSEWESPHVYGPDITRLQYKEIRAIEYIEWEETGPMLDIKGRFHLKNGETLPCRIVLVWRLTEPKILGERP